VVGGTTQVAMADFDTIKPNTGDIYFGNLVEFGYLNGAGAFAGHSDYSAIKNQKGFRRDDVYRSFFRPGRRQLIWRIARCMI